MWTEFETSLPFRSLHLKRRDPTLGSRPPRPNATPLMLSRPCDIFGPYKAAISVSLALEVAVRTLGPIVVACSKHLRSLFECLVVRQGLRQSTRPAPESKKIRKGPWCHAQGQQKPPLHVDLLDAPGRNPSPERHTHTWHRLRSGILSETFKQLTKVLEP